MAIIENPVRREVVMFLLDDHIRSIYATTEISALAMYDQLQYAFYNLYAGY